MCMILISLCGWYPKIRTVVEVENSIVVVEVANGDPWEMNDDEWVVDDEVGLSMNRNNTITMYDDIIVDAYK